MTVPKVILAETVNPQVIKLDLKTTIFTALVFYLI